MNNVDPVTGNNDRKYHGSTNRVSRTIMLLSFKDESLDQQTNLPKDTFTHSMIVPNVCNAIFIIKLLFTFLMSFLGSPPFLILRPNRLLHLILYTKFSILIFFRNK